MSDFEYEFEMTLMNRHLSPETEVLFLMASLNCLYVSSSRLKELARFGAPVDDFVPPLVARHLYEKLGQLGEALTAWRRYLQIHPDGPWAEVARQRLLRDQP